MLCLVRTERLLLHNFCKCIIAILVITFMQVIYTYIPEPSRVSKVYSSAAVLHVQILLHAEICFVVLH